MILVIATFSFHELVDNCPGWLNCLCQIHDGMLLPEKYWRLHKGVNKIRLGHGLMVVVNDKILLQETCRDTKLCEVTQTYLQ